MNSNSEELTTLLPALDRIEHIHIAGKDRKLEDTLSSPYILKALNILKENGYNKSISFETTFGDISSALKTLKNII